MTNKANLELQFLNLQTTDDIIVKRFFLVHFIDPCHKGSNLRYYLCLIWRYNKLYENSKPAILVKLSDKVFSPVKDVRHFFGEQIVLQQFWSSFRVPKSISHFANSFRERKCTNSTLASSIVYNCYRNRKLDGSLVFCTVKEEEKYDHIIFPIKSITDYYDHKKKELIIFPKDIQVEEILSDPKIGKIDATFLPCFAFWIGWTEELEIKSYKSFNYDITYDLLLSNDLQFIDENNNNPFFLYWAFLSALRQ